MNVNTILLSDEEVELVNLCIAAVISQIGNKAHLNKEPQVPDFFAIGN